MGLYRNTERVSCYSPSIRQDQFLTSHFFLFHLVFKFLQSLTADGFVASAVLSCHVILCGQATDNDTAVVWLEERNA